MKTTIIQTIIALSTANQYANCVVSSLRYKLNIKQDELMVVLNELEAEGFIVIRDFGKFQTVKPTPKAYKLYPASRTVSREQALRAYDLIMQLTKETGVVDYALALSRVKAAIGEISGENAIAKLIKVGYLATTSKGTRYAVSLTDKGTNAYAKALVEKDKPKTKTKAKSYYKPLSKEEVDQQALLKELSKHAYVIKRYEQLTKNPNYVVSDSFKLDYENACACANVLRAELGFH